MLAMYKVREARHKGEGCPFVFHAGWRSTSSMRRADGKGTDSEKVEDEEGEEGIDTRAASTTTMFEGGHRSVFLG